MPIIPAPQRLKQDDFEFKASLGLYNETLSQKERKGEREGGKEGGREGGRRKRKRKKRPDGPQVMQSLKTEPCAPG
jgi:hypothetical protein